MPLLEIFATKYLENEWVSKCWLKYAKKFDPEHDVKVLKENFIIVYVFKEELTTKIRPLCTTDDSCMLSR